ncbi:MAG TPA: stage V sporulation protein S [Anaerolineaceae bacterium]|nr:stage V sporulation protein S [Anaerolineaceae bacterium]
MQIEYDNTKPIYLQIMRLLNYKIVRGEYKPGDKLPSWVDAGLMFNVNHNTIARTYLEQDQIDLAVVPSFHAVEIAGQERTAIHFAVFRRPPELMQK